MTIPKHPTRPPAGVYHPVGAAPGPGDTDDDHTLCHCFPPIARCSAAPRPAVGPRPQKGWKLDRHRPPGRAQRISLRLEPKRRERVAAVAMTAGGDISARLRHALHLVTMADFPANWQAASAEQQHAPQRSHDSRQYGTRFMLRLDETSLGNLDNFTEFFVTSRANVIRQ